MIPKKYSGPSASSSSDVDYDYSHVDEQRQALAAAGAATGDLATAAYAGAVPEYMSTAHKIRALQQQAASIDPRPRVRGIRNSSSVNSPDYEFFDPRQEQKKGSDS
jgi:hypothetical protein